MGKSDIEIAVLRHTRARISDLRRKQTRAVVLPHEIITSMDPRTYRAVTEGNIEEFEVILQENEVPVLNQVTPQGNTILHIAAINGHGDLVERILNHELEIVGNWNPVPNNYRGLLVRPNSDGNLALHVVAAAGHAVVVNFLIDFLRRLPHEMQIVLEGPRLVAVRDVFTVGNNEQNTALHQALKAKHRAVALCLIAEDHRVSFILNKEGESPLYMAAEAGNVALVREMLQAPDAWFEGKSVVHAAIKSQTRDILDLLLGMDTDLIDSRDEEGRSLLSYAAYVGYEEGVRHLLEIFARSRAVAYVRDQDGFFPIHTACRKGHTATLRMILQFCPDTIELLNLQGQNVLHVAAESGKNEVVKYLLRNRKYGKLINQRDSAGNTPLHLAAMYWYPRVVYTLTGDKRVSLGELNKEGFTALDAAEGYLESNPTFRERLTWMALVCAGTPRALKPMPLDLFPSSMTREVAVPQSETGVLQTHERPTAKKYRDRVNTLLLLAILVATMAFSAAFKIPRGSNGLANRYKQGAFQVFVVSNTMAMYSAVLTTVALLWAQLGDLNLILRVFKFVLPLLGFALISMCWAFVAGLLVVIGHHHWLPVFLFASGGVFFLVLLLLVIPFVCPYTSSPLVFRYVLRYPFCLLMLTVWNDSDDDDDLD